MVDECGLHFRMTSFHDSGIQQVLMSAESDSDHCLCDCCTPFSRSEMTTAESDSDHFHFLFIL